jgi:hypothetical protein
MNNRGGYRTLPAINVLAAFAVITFSAEAAAVRPFITDDARVVGNHQLQLEASLRWDMNALQQLNLFAFGPTEWLELTLGFEWGLMTPKNGGDRGGIAGPIVQVKALALDAVPNKWPGLAFVAGTSMPLGTGGLPPPDWAEFIYAAATESLLDKERILIHANLGVYIAEPASGVTALCTWGLGMQVRVVYGLHVLAEIFSGDPYSGAAGGAWQAGLRYIINDTVQVDSSVGNGIWGSSGNQPMPFWASAGVRVVSGKLW